VSVAATLLALALAPAAAAGPFDAQATLRPATVLFGDLVTADVEVVVDSSVVEPASVRIVVSPAPFRRLGRPDLERWEADGVAVVRQRVRVVCVSKACLASGRPRRSVLPRARVSARTRDGRTLAIRPAWTPLEIVGRVPPQALTGAPAWRFDETPPSPSYRASPSLLAGALWGLAAVLALAAVAVIVGEVLRSGRGRALARLTPLEAALAAVRAAVSDDEPGRRRAAGALARVLAARDGRLVNAASELAWSETLPEPSRLAALAEQVEQEIGRR
jgi:hypothetical protein